LRRGRNGYAIITFENNQGAKKCIDQFHNKKVRGRKLNVQPSRKRAIPERSQYCTTVYVSGLKKDTTSAQITDFFKSSGKILTVRFAHKGFARVFFADVSGAQKAVAQKNGKEINGSTISVKYSIAVRGGKKALKKLRNARDQKQGRLELIKAPFVDALKLKQQKKEGKVAKAAKTTKPTPTAKPAAKSTAPKTAAKTSAKPSAKQSTSTTTTAQKPATKQATTTQKPQQQQQQSTAKPTPKTAPKTSAKTATKKTTK